MADGHSAKQIYIGTDVRGHHNLAVIPNHGQIVESLNVYTKRIHDLILKMYVYHIIERVELVTHKHAMLRMCDN